MGHLPELQLVHTTSPGRVVKPQTGQVVYPVPPHDRHVTVTVPLRLLPVPPQLEQVFLPLPIHVMHIEYLVPPQL